MPNTSTSSSPKITVCVFAWDEVETITMFVTDTTRVLERIGVPWEIVIIDDGSTDGTGAAADALVKEEARGTIRVVHHPENAGVGNVYRTGFREARGEYMTFFPADAQFPATILEDLHREVRDRDMVLGYIPKRRGDLVGKTLSRIERALYHVLLGPMPRFQGVFMVRRSIVESTKFVSTGRGWAIVMELIVRTQRSGYRMKSIPTAYVPRIAGVSKVNSVRNIRANMQQLLTLRRQLASE